MSPHEQLTGSVSRSIRQVASRSIVSILCPLCLDGLLLIALAQPGQISSGASIPDADLRIAGVTLGKDTFEDVQLKLGASKIFRASSAESAASVICYVSARHDDHTKLMFESGSAGGWSTVTGFQITSKGKFKVDVEWLNPDNCAKSSLISAQIHTPGGLRLGITRSQLRHILGKPSKVEKDEYIDEYIYDSLTNKKVKQSGKMIGVLVEKAVEALFVKEKLVRIRVVFTETT